MKLSEKTIELNICAQINQYLNRRILWFGLTQKQEAKAGFDAAFNLRGRIILFQFKASNYVLKNGARRFYLEHGQLIKLINQVNRGHRIRRSVFYVFPMIGNTISLYNCGGNLLGNTWFLDVSNLPTNFPLPISKRNPNQIRANNLHYADVLPPVVTIHSDPVESKLESLENIIKNNFTDAEGINSTLFENGKNYKKALEILKPFRKNFMMAVLPEDVYEKYNIKGADLLT